MASALESPVSGCIFRLVVVSVSHGFGTFSSAARHEIPVSSSGSRTGGLWGFLFFFLRSASPVLPSETRTGPAWAFWGTARGRGREGYGGMMITEVGGGYGGGSRGLATPLQRPCLHRTAGCSVTWEGGRRREEVGEVGTARRGRLRADRGSSLPAAAERDASERVILRNPRLSCLRFRTCPLAEMAVCKLHCAFYKAAISR